MNFKITAASPEASYSNNQASPTISGVSMNQVLIASQQQLSKADCETMREEISQESLVVLEDIENYLNALDPMNEDHNSPMPTTDDRIQLINKLEEVIKKYDAFIKSCAQHMPVEVEAAKRIKEILVNGKKTVQPTFPDMAVKVLIRLVEGARNAWDTFASLGENPPPILLPSLYKYSR